MSFVKRMQILLFVLVFTTIAFSQSQQTINNKDVIDLLKAKIPESTILLAIENSPTNFDISPNWGNAKNIRRDC